MEKIITLQYHGRTFQITEEAQIKFQDYEKTLKNHFQKEEGGEEIFLDLQHRMAEILEQKGKNEVIHTAMIDELISIIGKPSDLETSEVENTANTNRSSNHAGKKLYRDSKERIIAGVCSGIANYFAIDPIAIRLLFVLIALFNVATLFKFNLAIMVYIIFWLVLTSKPLTPNISRKLFRNASDRVIGGVCSGIAHFFGTETWIVRLIFISPILISMLAGSEYRHFTLAGHSLGGITVISYIILWVITPLAKTPTDYMLLKGEPININTIQSKTSMNLVATRSNNSLSKILKIIAYICILLVAVMLIPVLLGIFTTGIFAYSISEIILFTDFNKTMAVLAMVCLCVVPFIAFFIWITRRVVGYKHPNKALRTTFMGLIGLGLFSGLLLTISLLTRMHTFVKKDTEYVKLKSTSDTLLLDALVKEQQKAENIMFDWNLSKLLLQKTASSNRIRAVYFNYQDTEDSNFSYSLCFSGAGAGSNDAYKNLDAINYTIQQSDNKLLIDPFISIPKNQAYNLQNLAIRVYVPSGKTLLISKELRNQLSHNIKIGDKSFYINYTSTKYNQDKIYTNESESGVIEIEGDWDKAKEERYYQSQEEKRRIIEEDIQTKKKEIEERRRALKDAERENDRILQERKRELEEAEREHEQLLRKKDRELKNASKEI